MVIPDLNVLLYATDSTSAHHGRCHRWLSSALASNETVGLGWQVVLGFLRLATKAPVFAKPLTVDQACDVIDNLITRQAVVVLEPDGRHLALLRELLRPLGTAGNLTSDAHLAALALGHRATLVSCDRDFARFPGLTWLNPLE